MEKKTAVDELSSQDQALVAAFTEIARAQCERWKWTEIEPYLAQSWARLRDRDSPHWSAIAPGIRAACDESAQQEKK